MQHCPILSVVYSFELTNCMRNIKLPKLIFINRFFRLVELCIYELRPFFSPFSSGKYSINPTSASLVTTSETIQRSPAACASIRENGSPSKSDGMRKQSQQARISLTSVLTPVKIILSEIPSCSALSFAAFSSSPQPTQIYLKSSLIFASSEIISTAKIGFLQKSSVRQIRAPC